MKLNEFQNEIEKFETGKRTDWAKPFADELRDRAERLLADHHDELLKQVFGF